MKHFSIQSMAIGIGIGMILTGILNIFFMDNLMYSMQNIDSDPFIKITNANEMSEDSEESQVSEVDNHGIEKGNVDNINPEEEVEENKTYKEIYINKGMTSEEIAKLLEEKGIILSRDEFIYVANNLQMTSRLKYGLKRIPMESTIEDILKILVKIN